MKRIVHEYLAELRGSTIKSTMIAVLLTLGLLLWGRLLLRDVPQVASANVPVPTLAAAQAPRASGGALRLAPPAPLDRDLFALDPSRYRRTAQSPQDDPSAKFAQGLTEEQRQAAVLTAAAQLRLQSIIEGPEPQVILNGRRLLPGQDTDGFTLVRVEPRAVVLEKDGVRVRLGL
jgi:hypothetical protein